MTSYRRWEDFLDERLRDPDRAVGYLNACLEDEEPEVFLLALRDVARARGGLDQLAERLSENPDAVVRMLSEAGNPELRTLETLLDALGFRLSISVRKAS